MLSDIPDIENYTEPTAFWKIAVEIPVMQKWNEFIVCLLQNKVYRTDVNFFVFGFSLICKSFLP